MTSRSVCAVALTVMLLTLAPRIAAQPTDSLAIAKQKAQSAVESWLALIDNNEFGESWDAAAAPFQERLERANWIRQAERLRDSVEALSSRTLTQTQYRDTFRRAPAEGPFVLFKYRTNRTDALFEELLLTIREDTTWKVTGYQVTPLPSSRP